MDTHALLWFLEGVEDLSGTARVTMEDRDSVLLVSAASVWEIAIKSSLGKLSVPNDLLGELDAQGFRFLDVSPGHAWQVRGLSMGTHKDPFDRLLAAQALYEGLPIISGDAQLDEYGIHRHW